MECRNCGNDDVEVLPGEEGEPDVISCYTCGLEVQVWS